MARVLVARPARDESETARVVALADARWVPADAVLYARVIQLSWGGAPISMIAAL